MRLHTLTDHHPHIVPMGALVCPKLAAIDALVSKYVDPSRIAPVSTLSLDWRTYLCDYFAGLADDVRFHASFMVAE